jgi:hypothetical protein
MFKLTTLQYLPLLLKTGKDLKWGSCVRTVDGCVGCLGSLAALTVI